MSKTARYIIYFILIAFAWVSQIIFSRENIWEPIAWTLFILAIATAIEVWGKP